MEFTEEIAKELAGLVPDGVIILVVLADKEEKTLQPEIITELDPGSIVMILTNIVNEMRAQLQKTGLQIVPD